MSPSPAVYRPPRSAEELLDRYRHGERSFPHTVLTDACIETSLPGVDLRDSALRIVFSDVDLTAACFRGADLAFSHFDASLVRVDFEEADLTWANLGWSNLTDANLRATDLRHAEFKSSRLDGCDFSRARLEQTSFLDVSLSSLCASRDVMHKGPSYVDHRTIVRSIRAPGLKDFLLRIGTPAVFVEYMVDCARSLTETAMFSLLQSTFISYGQPDAAFARRLYEALHSTGVRTFFFPEHAVPGKKLHRTIREGVNDFDRVILICSRGSLERHGVLNEIEETLQREARDGGASYLIPIRLDDYIFHGWTPADRGLAQTIRDRVVADFTDLDSDPEKFNRSLQRLIAALKKDTPSSL